MQAKKLVCFFSVLLLLFAGLMCSAGAAADPTATFSGGGVTVDLQYPEEAHPNTTITHNVTITAHADLSLQSFTLFIYAPINAIWQEVKNRTISWDFLENETLTSRIEFQLPQDTNGTLYCEMTLKTDQTAETLSYKFYTTQVREMTYSELLENYNILNNTYNQLLADYDTLNNTYNELQSSYIALNSSFNELVADFNSLNETYYQSLADYDVLNNTYNNLQTSYGVLNSSYTELTAIYDTLNENYNDLESKYTSYKYTSYDSLLANYNGLQSDYDTLNSTHYSLEANYTTLQTAWNTLNETYTELKTTLTNLQRSASDSENALNVDKVVMVIFIIALVCLIAFIIYIKRKTTSPYVVIRKETVSMKQDEKS
jgi:predicted nuclease with TOPRIM domain